MSPNVPTLQLRALADARTITVYQAYSHAIADAALEAQRFVAPFSFERMTWVKPSFLWMMERCGWATKANQERVLAVRLHRRHFDALVAMAVPTHFDPRWDATHEAWRARLATARAHVQWDPERNARGAKLNHRTIQLGIGRALVKPFATEWLAGLDDVTPLVTKLRGLRREGEWDLVERLLPVERPYDA
ncbi:MAG: DUF4291 domain-containing protein [Myxococcales bacterium]|nr:DUF4291 domain-containing protein [Myxococcales bacterium]